MPVEIGKGSSPMDMGCPMYGGPNGVITPSVVMPKKEGWAGEVCVVEQRLEGVVSPCPVLDDFRFIRRWLMHGTEPPGRWQ